MALLKETKCKLLTIVFILTIFGCASAKYVRVEKYASSDGTCKGSIRVTYNITDEDDAEGVDTCLMGIDGDTKVLETVEGPSDADLFIHKLNVKYFKDSTCTTEHGGLGYDGASVREGLCYKGTDHIEANIQSYRYTITSDNMLMESRFDDSINCTGYNPSRHYFTYSTLTYKRDGVTRNDSTDPKYPNPRVVDTFTDDGEKGISQECLYVCPKPYINTFGEEACPTNASYYVTWTVDTKFQGKTTDLTSFFMVLLYIGLVPFGTMIIFWGPVTAMRRSKNPKIKKVTVVQVTPARGFDGVATAPRKKAKI